MTRMIQTKRWFFAKQNLFTWRPRVDVNEFCVWNVWWLWFEVARLRSEVIR